MLHREAGACCELLCSAIALNIILSIAVVQEADARAQPAGRYSAFTYIRAGIDTNSPVRQFIQPARELGCKFPRDITRRLAVDSSETPKVNRRQAARDAAQAEAQRAATNQALASFVTGFVSGFVGSCVGAPIGYIS